MFELIEFQLLEIQGELLVKGSFYLSGGVTIFSLVPFGFVVKGGDIHAYTLADLEGCMVVCMVIDEMVVANSGCQCMVVMVVANNSKEEDCCSQWSLCYSCWHQCCSSVVSWHQSMKYAKSVVFVKG